MTYLGVDYGSNRIGLAKGNSEERLAMPLFSLSNNEALLSELQKLLLEEEIEEIVVGVPVSFDGKEYQTAKDARAFGETLKKLGRPVHFVSEILTSKQSRASGASDVDASSAALILQGYLDSQLNS